VARKRGVSPVDKGSGWLASGRQNRDYSQAASEVTPGSSSLPAVPQTRGRSLNVGQDTGRAHHSAEHGKLLCSSTTESPQVRSLGSKKVYLPWVLDGHQNEVSRSPSPDRHVSSATSAATVSPEQSLGRQRMDEMLKRQGMDEILKPTPFSSWANDAVRIRMVRNASDLADPTRQFQPLFTHQVFGGKEEIVGFENPVVQIVYAANSLRPCICFGASDKVARSQLKPHGLKRTDVLASIRMNAPSDYAASTQEVLDDASHPASNRPLGKVLATYLHAAAASSPESDATFPAAWRSGAAPLPSASLRQEETESGRESGSEFRVYLTDLKSAAAQVLLKLALALALALARARSLALALSLSLSLSDAGAAEVRSRSRSPSLSLALARSLSHAHTQTHTRRCC
jgi:hypothetical protein